MKRYVVIGLGFLIVLAVSGVMSSSASALVICVKTDQNGTGNHNVPNCSDREVANGEFIEVNALETRINPGLWCARVQILGTGKRKTNLCNTVEEAGQEFTLIKLGGWRIAGAALPPGSKAALSTKAVVDEPATLNVPGLSLKISCSGLSGTKPEIIGENEGAVEHLTFEGCSEITPTTCKLETPTISTEPITALAFDAISPDVRVHFTPKSGKSFATLTFVGSCSLAGEKPVNGTVTVDAPNGQSEEVSHALAGLGSQENNSLEVSGQKGYLEKGKALLKLASGSKWSFS
jgi:hypothetical protein